MPNNTQNIVYYTRPRVHTARMLIRTHFDNIHRVKQQKKQTTSKTLNRQTINMSSEKRKKFRQ